MKDTLLIFHHTAKTVAVLIKLLMTLLNGTLEKTVKSKYQKFLIAFQCYYCISKDFYANIEKRLGISSSTINRKLESLSSKTILKNQFLPKIMNWDEFKATKDTTGKMAFIVLNNETGEIYDIKDCRKKDYLEKYF